VTPEQNEREMREMLKLLGDSTLDGSVGIDRLALLLGQLDSERARFREAEDQAEKWAGSASDEHRAYEAECEEHGKTQLALDEATAMRDAVGQKAWQLQEQLKAAEARINALVAGRTVPGTPEAEVSYVQDIRDRADKAKGSADHRAALVIADMTTKLELAKRVINVAHNLWLAHRRGRIDANESMWLMLENALKAWDPEGDIAWIEERRPRPCLLCDGNGHCKDTAGAYMVCPVVNDPWHPPVWCVWCLEDSAWCEGTIGTEAFAREQLPRWVSGEGAEVNPAHFHYDARPFNKSAKKAT
jgi:hypothetical protein